MLLRGGEERLQPVVILLADRIELVIVAARATDRQPEEGRADDVRPLGQHFVAAEGDFLVARVPPHRAEPMEPRGDLHVP